MITMDFYGSSLMEKLTIVEEDDNKLAYRIRHLLQQLYNIPGEGDRITAADGICTHDLSFYTENEYMMPVVGALLDCISPETEESEERWQVLIFKEADVDLYTDLEFDEAIRVFTEYVVDNKDILLEVY